MQYGQYFPRSSYFTVKYKSTKYGKYWPYCTLNRAITNAYFVLFYNSVYDYMYEMFSNLHKTSFPFEQWLIPALLAWEVLFLLNLSEEDHYQNHYELIHLWSFIVFDLIILKKASLPIQSYLKVTLLYFLLYMTLKHLQIILIKIWN